MSKSVVLVLEPNHESEYGEYANTPVFNAHGNIIGWTGGEVPESGHPCEFNVLNDEGFTSCASSTTVNKLRDENEKLRELVRRYVEYTSQDRCEGCVFKLRCNDGEVDECWQLTEIRELARELGIEMTK